MDTKYIRWISALIYATVMVVGWWYPPVALVAFALMGLVLLTGKRKKWCGSYCPRGSFLDMVMKHLSPKKPVPKWMTGKRIWYISLGVFLAMFTSQILLTGLWNDFSWWRFGVVAYRMCLITSLVALPLALWRNHRAWCSVCPVGNLLRR
ncbi:4Fe-4S binding protein [Dethiosulfovibrio salsuginis]|uniref:4Fe-4S binding domain-containing protein n=1 Tax=Dethiosulfovibrio salsuginis TaxID=561720 RepID=A0A1X7LCZ0_9BACT|nr:4Fe-4S binding protein [Dethiosulfovibrio salsuginis]SMG51039.1 4Fe-4S binding domain-containing protein [Dethiosulfovibrio salsuginis]